MPRISLPAGTRVHHRVFGDGTVLGEFIDSDGCQGRLVVEWDNHQNSGEWWYWDFFGHCELEVLLTYGP